MRLGPEQVGRRGWLLVAATGVVGLALAVHGYGRGVVVTSTGLPAGGTTASTVGPPTSAPTSATTSTPPTSTPSASTAGPSRSTTTTTAPSQNLGPLLSSTQYARYAYQVYPGPQSSRTRQATAGFTIKVTPSAGSFSLSVTATASGQGTQTSSYPAGDKVYFVETTFGDDSGDSDYDFGDDGVVVTDARGYLVK